MKRRGLRFPPRETPERIKSLIVNISNFFFYLSQENNYTSIYKEIIKFKLLLIHISSV